uniref:Uncharacterized protein n=1 Tax=Meloidogyne enterolobii TaxID=390850 RepID=A0A6V7U5I7_MELEN|nr:unnamed protein product [Meloidogyne enterolobii]
MRKLLLAFFVLYSSFLHVVEFQLGLIPKKIKRKDEILIKLKLYLIYC